MQDFDPFLMLDGFDSLNPEDYISGFPWHPHRGIETVTYLVSGEIEHGDSLGNSGLILSGGAQWMTAGSGIIHQEMPMPSERMLGCQLWVNLPSKDKMCPPRYGDIHEGDVPVVADEGVEVRIISGSYQAKEGAFSPQYARVTYLDVKLKANVTWEYKDRPNSETLFIYLLDGSLACEEDLSAFEEKGCAVLFGSSNKDRNTYEQVIVKSGSSGARFVLLAAEPLNEPIAWGGPVVMNTKKELEQAFDELDQGVFIKDNAASI